MIDKATMSPKDYENTRKRFHNDAEQTLELEPAYDVNHGVQKYFGTLSE